MKGPRLSWAEYERRVTQVEAEREAGMTREMVAWLREVHERAAMSVTASTLTRIEAERAIIQGYEGEDSTPWGGCGDDCEFVALGWAVRHLVWGWRTQPGYRDEWTP